MPTPIPMRGLSEYLLSTQSCDSAGGTSNRCRCLLYGTTGLSQAGEGGVMEAEIAKPLPHRFQTGNNWAVGHGRPKGSRPKLSALFWDDLYAVWKAKGMGVLERMADDDPVNFAKIAAMLVGKAEDVNGERDMRGSVVEQFIEERRQEALKMIEKMGEEPRAAWPNGRNGEHD
jgi:hypothetical protein